MGRYKWSRRGLTDECRFLSADKMASDGVFKKGPGNFWNSIWKNEKGEVISSLGYWFLSYGQNELALQLNYDQIDPSSGARSPEKYPVKLTTTTQANVGGLRYWFICPLVTNGQPCQRRVGLLYLPPGGRYFGCRKCYNLTYRCQREHNKKIDA